MGKNNSTHQRRIRTPHQYIGHSAVQTGGHHTVSIDGGVNATVVVEGGRGSEIEGYEYISLCESTKYR